MSTRRYLARFHREVPSRCLDTHRRGTARRPSSNSEPHTASQSGAISNASPATSSTQMFSLGDQLLLGSDGAIGARNERGLQLCETVLLKLLDSRSPACDGRKRTRRSPRTLAGPVHRIALLCTFPLPAIHAGAAAIFGSRRRASDNGNASAAALQRNDTARSKQHARRLSSVSWGGVSLTATLRLSSRRP